jgi:hypothetical protein
MGVAALLKQGLTNQEEIMAKFDGLDADINDLRTEVGACAARVEAAIGPLMDDTADQSEVDAARAEVRAAVDALKAIAPAPEPAPEPAPTEPPTF